MEQSTAELQRFKYWKFVGCLPSWLHTHVPNFSNIWQFEAELLITERTVPDRLIQGNFVQASSLIWMDRSTPNLGRSQGGWCLGKGFLTPVEGESGEWLCPSPENFLYFFTMLHTTWGGISQDKAIHPSVRPSVKGVNCAKKGRNFCQNSHTTRKNNYYHAAWNADAVYRWEFCPSVCLSVCHTRVLWQNGRKICPDLYTIRKNI